jgi:hypothetical protein
MSPQSSNRRNYPLSAFRRLLQRSKLTGKSGRNFQPTSGSGLAYRNFLIEVAGRKIVIPQTHLLRKNPGVALSVMNIISHENTFMKEISFKAMALLTREKMRLWNTVCGST